MQQYIFIKSSSSWRLKYSNNGHDQRALLSILTGCTHHLPLSYLQRRTGPRPGLLYRRLSWPLICSLQKESLLVESLIFHDMHSNMVVLHRSYMLKFNSTLLKRRFTIVWGYFCLILASNIHMPVKSWQVLLLIILSKKKKVLIPYSVQDLINTLFIRLIVSIAPI